MGGGKTSKALEISQLNGLDLFTLFDLTNRIRDKFKGNEVNLCAKGRAGFYSDGARSGFHPDKLFKPDQGHKNRGGKSFNPHGCLKIIAVYRCIHPRRDIFICGGREIHLRDLQPLMFMAGANGTMVGNYFTTCGRPAEEDITVIKDLGLRVKQ